MSTPTDSEANRDSRSVSGIYIASKTKHAPRWRALRDAGYPIISTWIDEAEPGQSTDLADLADRCIRESRDAALFVVYCEPGETLKGGLIEVGARLGVGKVVVCVGTCESTRSAFGKHPLWRERASVDEALAEAASAPAPTPPASAAENRLMREALTRIRKSSLADFVTPLLWAQWCRDVALDVFEAVPAAAADGGGGPAPAASTAQEKR